MCVCVCVCVCVCACVKSTWSHVSFKFHVSLLIFCLDDLLIGCKWRCYSPLLLFIAFNFSLNSVNINFIHHGILWLSAYIFINIKSSHSRDFHYVGYMSFSWGGAMAAATVCWWLGLALQIFAGSAGLSDLAEMQGWVGFLARLVHWR